MFRRFDLRLASAAAVFATLAFACGGLTSPGYGPDASTPCAPGAAPQSDPPAPSGSGTAAPPLVPPMAGLPPYFYGDAGRALRYVAFGDSMTSGLEGGTVSYPEFSRVALGSAVAVFNNGHSGQPLWDMLPTEDDYLVRWFVDGGANVASILAGTNDMHAYDAGPADCYGDLLVFARHAHAIGFSVIVMTLPRPDKFVADDMRAEYNRMIREGWPSFADAMIDLDADPALADMTIGDGVHPNGDGHQRIASLVAPVVATLLARQGARRGGALDAGAPP